MSIKKLRAHHAKSLETIRHLRSALHYQTLLVTDLKSKLAKTNQKSENAR
jgi:hypothetical protein